MFKASFRSYSIVYLNEKTGETDEKCTRSYDEIYMFYQKLLNEFPFIPIPKLTTKDFINKITTKLSDNEASYTLRLTQINFFFNYLHEHPEISNHELFILFVNEKEFNTDKFTINKPYLDITESSKYMGAKSNIIGFFKNLVGYLNYV